MYNFKNNKITIAIDFDGTITKNNIYPKIGEPNMQVVNKIKSLDRSKYDICLWTCRTGAALIEALEYCNNLELNFDYINTDAYAESKGLTPLKIYADYYVDDKCLSVNDFIKSTL